MSEIHRWFQILIRILPVYFSFPVALRHSQVGLYQHPLFNTSVRLNKDGFIWLKGEQLLRSPEWKCLSVCGGEGEAGSTHRQE